MYHLVGDNARGKEVCTQVAIDPVAMLVFMTNNVLLPGAASDLLDEHNGNVQDAHQAWITAQSVQHTHGASNEGESSGHTTVRYAASTGTPQARVAEARQIINERGGLAAAVETDTPTQTAPTPQSIREKIASAAKRGNRAARPPGGNVYHGPLLGSPRRIARSELLAFEALQRFTLEIRRTPTLSGMVRAAAIHTEFIDLHPQHAHAHYASHDLGIFREITDSDLLDLLKRLATHSQMYAWYVQITINLGYDPADRLPSGLTALQQVEAIIAMFLSSYAPLTHIRSAHAVPPQLGGVYELETLGLMHHALLRSGGGSAISVLLVDIVPNYPGRSDTLPGGMRDVYAVLAEYSPSAQALLVRTAIGMITEMSLLHNNARVAAGLPAMPEWATMGGFARDTAAAYGFGGRKHMVHMEVR